MFECSPDGSVYWRGEVHGLADVRRHLHQLWKSTSREYFALQVLAHELVFRADPSRNAAVIAPRIVQICYAKPPCESRAELLRQHGYGVLSITGSEAAKRLLELLPLDKDDIAFFFVGHAAPDDERKQIVAWLKKKYPTTKIVVLNSPRHEIPGADYNVLQNGPGAWLPLLSPSKSPAVLQ